MVRPMFGPRLLLVDNHDSFTHNLAQLLAEACGIEPIVVPNETPWAALPLDRIDGVVLSPGPGRPDVVRDFGICRALIARFEGPLLGVCLGHQGIAAAFGARIGPAPEVMHGRLSPLVDIADDPLFAGVPEGTRVVRYHSLAVFDLPPTLRPLAWSDDGVLMALRHRDRPLWGVQFHPESICTESGRTLLGNFVDRVGRHRAATAPTAGPKAPEATHRLVFEALPTAPDPEAAFARLFHGREGAFWLDSAPGHGRFHVIGDGPVFRYRVGDSVVRSRGKSDAPTPDLWRWLTETLSRTRIADAPRPFPFPGGLVGCLGYGLKAETIGDRSPPGPHPDALFIRADRFLVVDSHGEAAWLASIAPLGEADPHRGWRRGMARALAELAPLPPPETPITGSAPTLALARSKARYLADIAQCMRALRAGESYEICLTTHLRTTARPDPLALHRRLRRHNPAPYAALLEFGDLDVVSASPERFLRVATDGTVEARPIKGTRPRSADPATDDALRRSLASAEKDRAENLMITDLLRNDLGRVCAVGSVHVPEMMQVESFATVHQLVSTVRGRLRPEASAVDCVRAAFPGGSMTGAPKKRTMEIIDRLEGTPRGLYSGALGWFGFDGAADLNIVIRTAIIDDAGCSIGVGGAIVALSDPVDELHEALLKGRALADAMGAKMPDIASE